MLARFLFMYHVLDVVSVHRLCRHIFLCVGHQNKSEMYFSKHQCFFRIWFVFNMSFNKYHLFVSLWALMYSWWLLFAVTGVIITSCLRSIKYYLFVQVIGKDIKRWYWCENSTSMIMHVISSLNRHQYLIWCQFSSSENEEGWQQPH